MKKIFYSLMVMIIFFATMLIIFSIIKNDCGYKAPREYFENKICRYIYNYFR